MIRSLPVFAVAMIVLSPCFAPAADAKAEYVADNH